MSAEAMLPCPFCGGKIEEVGLYSGQCRGIVNGKEVHNTIVMNNAAWNRRTPPAPAEAVAWRVKDYADGWILFHHEAPARKSASARNGALVQPLYTHPPQPDAPGWRDIATAPMDGTVIIAMARYRTATAGFPCFVAFIEGEWRELGRKLMEPMVCWSWISRDVLPAWPAEPPPPSADTKRSEPDALPGDLREKVIGDLEALKVWLQVGSIHEPDKVKSGVCWDYSCTVDEAIALIIQSERGGA